MRHHATPLNHTQWRSWRLIRPVGRGLDQPQLEALKALIDAEIEKSLGTPMIYTIADEIQVGNGRNWNEKFASSEKTATLTAKGMNVHFVCYLQNFLRRNNVKKGESSVYDLIATQQRVPSSSPLTSTVQTGEEEQLSVVGDSDSDLEDEWRCAGVKLAIVVELVPDELHESMIDSNEC